MVAPSGGRSPATEQPLLLLLSATGHSGSQSSPTLAVINHEDVPQTKSADDRDDVRGVEQEGVGGLVGRFFLGGTLGLDGVVSRMPRFIGASK